MAELDYAATLGVPVVPVQIGPVDRPRLSPIAHIQIIDYRDPTATSAIALIAALQDGAERRGELPDPLPDPPPIPYEYLMRLSAQIDSPVLQHTDQLGIMTQLRDSLEIEDDDDIRADLNALLGRLRSRPDVTFRVADEIDALLRQYDNIADQNSTAASTRAAPVPHQSLGAPTARVGLTSRQMPPASDRRQQPPQHEPSPSQVPPAISPSTPPSKRWRAITAIVLGILGVFPLFGVLPGTAGIIFAQVAKSRNEPLANIAFMISIAGLERRSGSSGPCCGTSS